MDLDVRVLTILDDLVNVGLLFKDVVLVKALVDGKPNIDFECLVSWLSKQITDICKLECVIHDMFDVEEYDDISDDEEDTSFSLEVSSFLRELYCPYSALVEGVIRERLIPRENKIKLLEFLISELLAARIIAYKEASKPPPKMDPIPESPMARDLKSILVTLNFGKPPPTITAVQVFTKVEEKLSNILRSSQKPLFEPVFSGSLKDEQWFDLDYIQEDMHAEYTIRRQMLLTRLDVTMQSFCWADRLKDVKGKIIETYLRQKAMMSVEPDVYVPYVLAADVKILVMNVASDARCRKNTRSAVNTIIIGPVPDRGGRPDEHLPPPPEVPSWEKNSGNAAGGGQPKNFRDNASKGMEKNIYATGGHTDKGGYGDTKHRDYQGGNYGDARHRDHPGGNCGDARHRDHPGGNYGDTRQRDHAGGNYGYNKGRGNSHSSEGNTYAYAGNENVRNDPVIQMGAQGFSGYPAVPTVVQHSFYPAHCLAPPVMNVHPPMMSYVNNGDLDYGIPNYTVGIGGYEVPMAPSGDNFHQFGAYSAQYAPSTSGRRVNGGRSRGRRGRGRRA